MKWRKRRQHRERLLGSEHTQPHIAWSSPAPEASALLSHSKSASPLQQPHPETKSLAKLMAHSPVKPAGLLEQACPGQLVLHPVRPWQHPAYALCPTDLFLSTSGVSGVKMMACSGAAAAAAKSLQSCPTLCNPTDRSPPDSPVPGILQTRTLEWVAISFSNAWKWKVKGKSLSRVRHFATPQTAAPRFFRQWDFPGKSTGASPPYFTTWLPQLGKCFTSLYWVLSLYSGDNTISEKHLEQCLAWRKRPRLTCFHCYHHSSLTPLSLSI